MIVHLDTSFVVDLVRERSSGFAGPATTRLDELSSEEVTLSVHALAELLTGVALAARPDAARAQLTAAIHGVPIALPDAQFAAAYAENYRQLEHAGRRMATMDLLIATAALIDAAPIVTGDVGDFSRLPALRVISY